MSNPGIFSALGACIHATLLFLTNWVVFQQALWRNTRTAGSTYKKDRVVGLRCSQRGQGTVMKEYGLHTVMLMLHSSPTHVVTGHTH